MRRIEELIARHSGQPLEKVCKDLERDYFMNAVEAVAYGIIDRCSSTASPDASPPQAPALFSPARRAGVSGNVLL